MTGQWIGAFDGDYKGVVMVNLDEFEERYGGNASFLPAEARFPGVQVSFRTETKERKLRIQTSVLAPVNPSTGLRDTWENVRHSYPANVRLPDSVTIEGAFADDSLTATVKTSLGSSFSAKATRAPGSIDSEATSQLPGEKIAWEDYKHRVGVSLKTSDIRGLIFRGQSKPWRLRTAFHRRRRYDLVRFVTDDVPSLYRTLGVRTRTRFHIDNPDEHGAFLSLAQHHGYPTPFLDWTYSPYVAAFFAFRELPKRPKESGNVRIFVFGRGLWHTDWAQVWNLHAVWPQVSVLDLLAIENDRSLPQQAVTMSTNMDDIESYVLTRGKEKGHNYFSVWDLDYSERNLVMTDLAHMGITAATMFPGPSGICEELRERNFSF